jgi:iron complex outermembrane receptor protein
MKNKTMNLRRRLMVFTACTMASATLSGVAAAQTVATPTSSSTTAAGGGSTSTTAASTKDEESSADAYKIKKVHIIYKKLLQKEKDLPSASTHLDEKDIQAADPTMGSIQTLLTQAPSVVAYSQGPGQSAPTLAIRGVRNSELAETLDGIPLTSLLGGSGNYLSNNVGSPVTLNELSGATVYPGAAPPEKQGFGTVGGTVAYMSKQPTDDRYEELEGGFGSFDTQHAGFTINTGKMYDSVDAPKAIMLYDQSQTAGYVSNTPAQYHDFLFNVEKPYNNGLSKVGLLIIFNQGKGTIQSVPTPEDQQAQYGWTYNFPESEGFYNQTGQFLTTVLSDETYINPHLIFNGSLFYQHASDTIDSYCAPNTTDGSITYAVNVQCPVNFYGDIGPDTYHYSPGYFTYDPTATFGSIYAGESSEYTKTWTNKIGIDPKLNIFLPHNTIAIGALVAKENYAAAQYIYGGTAAQENQINGYDSFVEGGGTQRSVYVGYISDKIDLLNNKLHIEPGARVTAAYTSKLTQMASYYRNTKYQNYTKVGEPYLGVSYDAPFHLVPYAAYGKSSLFAPAAYYKGGLTGLPGTTHAPSPEIVHMYEAGLKYVTPRVYLSADYFYQQISDAFSFYENYDLGQYYYANEGGYIMRGVEIAGKVRVTPELTLSGNGSWNSAKYTNSNYGFVTLQQDQFGYVYKGTPVSNVPDYLFNVAADYDKGPWATRLWGVYTGREYMTTNIIDPDCNGGANMDACESSLSGATTTDLNNTNDPSFVLNFMASYKIPVHTKKLKSLTLTFTALNVIDLHYYTYQYNSDIAYQGVYSINPNYKSGLIGPPRSLQLDLVARF